MNHEIVITGGLIIYPEKTIKGDIGIKDGTIAEVAAPGSLSGEQTVDAEGLYVLPGIIDPHVHPVYVDKIGDTSKSALHGGVTTQIHYAYARPGNSLIDKIKEFREEGEADSYADFALHGGLFETLKQADEISEAFTLGVTSFKVFMSYAKLGWMTDDYAMAKVMDIVGKLGGLTAVHAETGLAIDYIMDVLLEEKADFAERFLETSPDIAEAEGIFRAVSIGRLMNCPVYIPHISSEAGVRTTTFLKANGYNVFAETCPHYLSLTWDQLKKQGPLGKVGPSIKTEQDRAALWEGMASGLFDTLGSDHAPKPKKPDDDFFDAPYGAPGIETLLPVVWQYGVNRGIITPNKVAALASENVARIMGLYPQKGRIEAKSDADLVLFDPGEVWTIHASDQHSNADYTLYEGLEVVGKVKKVFSRGELVIDGDELKGKPGRGRFLSTRAGNFLPGV